MTKKRAKDGTLPALRAPSDSAPTKLLRELRNLIQSTRSGLAQAVNSALVRLYWQVGERIRTEILKSGRAAYGEQIVSTLSRQLAAEFGNGYSRPNLFRMIRFAELFTDREHEMEPGEEMPIGLILCADKGDEQVELLQLDKSGIRVASYLTDLPPRQLLRRKLHEMMVVARSRLEGHLAEDGRHKYRFLHRSARLSEVGCF